MAAEGGILEPISEKIIDGEIENIRFDHIPKIKEVEGSPEQAYDDMSIKTEVSEPVSLQNLEILRDGHSQPSPAATHDNGIIIDDAKNEILHQVTTETFDNTGGQIFNKAPPGVQISLEDNCKAIDASFQADSNKEEKEMPKSTNINPIASDEDSKEDGHASDEGKEHGTEHEAPAKSSQGVDVVKDEGEDNEGRTEQEITEKTTSQTEISEKPTSEVGVKLMEGPQTEHEDASPGFTDAMKNAGEEPLPREEKTIYQVDLVSIKESDSTLQNSEIISDNKRVTSLDNTETTENDVRALGENQNLKQDINTATEEPKAHELTPTSIEERVAEEDKQKEFLHAAFKEAGVETEDTNEEQETIEGDTSVQRSATELQDLQLPIEKSPMPSTTETSNSTEAQDQETEEEEASGQRTASELPHLQSTIEESPMHISTPISEHVTHSETGNSLAAISVERVGEDEKLKESSNSETREPCAETQDATEEQDKTTEVGDASTQLPMSERHHLPEKSPVQSKTEDQRDIDGARESALDNTQDQVIEEEKLEESSNIESVEPGAHTQDSTEEQEETEEGDASHMSTSENLPIKNHPAGISTSTAEAPRKEDEAKELAPALQGDRIRDDEKTVETSNVVPEIPATETEASVKKQEKAIDEGDAFFQKSASEELRLPLQIDKPPVPSTTEGQLRTDDAKELAPGFTKKHVKEEENLKELSNSEVAEPGTEEQDAAEEQDKTTDEGCASTQLSTTELHHLPTGKSPLPSKTEDQLDVNGAWELAPDYTEDQMREEKLKESPNVELAKKGSKTQDITEEEEEETDGDLSARMTTSEHLSIKNPVVDFSTSTTEAQLEKDGVKGLAPTLTEDRMGEDETVIETSNVTPEIPATETEDAVAEQEKATEEVNASLQKSASEEFQSPLQIEISREPSTSEDQLEIDGARELAPGFTKAHVKEEENLEESSDEETQEPGTETQNATEEQQKATGEGDHSVQLSVMEPHYVQTEKYPLTSKTEDQFHKDGADYTDDQVRKEEKLKESSNTEAGEPATQTQDSTNEQEETEEGDVSAHVSTCEHLSLENSSAGISTSSTEAQLQEDDEKELAPALREDRMEEDKKLIETSDVAPEIPLIETEDSVEEHEKTIEEGDASLQKSASEELHSPLQRDKPPVPSTTEDQLKTDDARELAPGFTKEHVKEEENLKESYNFDTGEPGTQAQDAAEKQNKTTEEGDASTQLSASELQDLPTEKSPLTTKHEDQLHKDGTDYTDDQVREEEKLKEPSNTESGEPANRMEEGKKLIETSDVAPEMPATEIEGSVGEQEKAIEEGDVSLQKSATIEISSVPSTTEDPLKIDDSGQLAPGFTKEHVKEEENLKEYSESETGKLGTEARDSTEEQYEQTEKGDASVETSSHEVPHLQFSIENPPVGISTSTAEAQLAEDDVKELVPASTENRMGEDQKLTDSSCVVSEEQLAETQGTLGEQEKATEEGDDSAQKSASQELHLQLQIKKSPVPSTTEDQSEIEDAREFAPVHIKEHVGKEDSTEEQDKETEERDASAQTSAGELPHLLLSENSPVDISNEAQLTGDEAQELVPAFMEDQMGERTNIASEAPGTERQNSVEAQEKANEEGDTLTHMPMSEEQHLQLLTEESPAPLATEDQPEIDDARDLAPGINEEQVSEEEKLQESSCAESGEAATQTRSSTEEQDKETEEGDASVHMSCGEQWSNENPPVQASSLTNEVQLPGVDARELLAALSEDRMGNNEKPTASSNAASKEPGNEIQDSVKEQEKASEEGDASTQMSPSEGLHLQLQIENSTIPSTTEDQLETDEVKELAPSQEATEDEKLKESPNEVSGGAGTETQESTGEQNEETEEENASVHMSAGERSHLSTENPSVHISASTTEARVMGHDARELRPAFTDDGLDENVNLKKSSNEQSREPGIETQYATEEQDKTTKEGDPSVQLSATELHCLQTEKSPLPSKTENQPDIDGSRESAPDYTQDQVIEEEKLEEYSNVASAEPGAQTQDSTEEQEETEEGDVSAHESTCEHLSMEHPPAGISTSTTEAQLQKDDVKGLAPALTEDRMEEDKKLMETSNAATETEDSVEEQEKANEEGDASLQKCASEEFYLPLQIEKSPVTSTTADQLEIETQYETQVQDKETKGDASTETSASNLSHLQYSIENPPLGISTTITDAQLAEDDVKEPVPALTENMVGEDEKVTESSVVASKQPAVDTQGSVEEQEEKESEEGDASAQKSNSELPHMQLSTEKSPKHTTEGQFETDDTRESGKAMIEEIMLEQENHKKSSNEAPGETCTETQGSSEEQDKANEERFSPVQRPASELHNLQLSEETSPKNSNASATENKSEADDLGDDVPTLNPRDENNTATSTGAIMQETIPDQEIIQQTDEAENILMTNTQGDASEIKHAEEIAGIEAHIDVIAIKHVDDLPKEFSEREILGVDNEEASDSHPREDETAAETGKNLLNPAPDMIEATRTEMESTRNEPFIKNAEENSQDKQTIYENIDNATSESKAEHQSHDGEQQTDNATYEMQDVSKTISDEQKQQTTASGNNLVEVKKDDADIEKDNIISESIHNNHSQDATSELGGQMIPPLADPNKCIDTAIVKAEDNSSNKISSDIDNVEDAETINDIVDDMQEKVPSSISEEDAHEITKINENIGTGTEITDDLETISESVPEEQNKESIFSASNIKTETMPEVVDNKIIEKVDLDEHVANAEKNFEANFNKNLADTSDIHITISEPMVDNVGGHNEEPSQKECEEEHNNTSANVVRDADVHEDEVECIEKHEIISELIPEKQNQETTGEAETPEVEKRTCDEKAGPVSSSESLIEASVEKDEISIYNAEETEKAHITSEEIPEKQDQRTSETETTEIEKRTCDEISESLSSSENLIEDNMQKNESTVLDVEEHDNKSSEANEILKSKLFDDRKTTEGAIPGPSSEEKDVRSVFEEEGTKKLEIYLNQGDIETANIRLGDSKDKVIPKDEETLYQTSDSSAAAEKFGMPINSKNRKLTISDEEGNDVKNSVNVEPIIDNEGCEDNEEQKFDEAAAKSDDRNQDTEISEETVMTKDANSHEKIKDSNIPTEGQDAERTANTETEKISSAEAETEHVLEEDKIVITPYSDIEDITINAEVETEKKLGTFHPLTIMVDQEDFQSQKSDQIESENASNVSMRDMISNEEVKYYMGSKEQNLETIAETDITKTKAADVEHKQLGEGSSNVADDSLAEETEGQVEKQDMSPDLSDKTQVPEFTDRDVGMDLDLLKGNSESLGQLENLATLESEDQSGKHITEIKIIKSDITQGILSAAQNSTEEKMDGRYTLPEGNNKSHDVSEAEVAPLKEATTVEEAVFAARLKPQDMVDNKIREDNGLQSEEEVESAETAKNQEDAMVEEEVGLSRENDNRESTPVSVSNTAETTMEEDAGTVITKEIENQDATHEKSPCGKIDDLSINHDLEEENLKGEASSPHSKVDNMETMTLEESEETCESTSKECQEVHDKNESLEDVSTKDTKEHLDKLSERTVTTSSMGEIEKEMIKKADSSVVHDVACQKDEIVIEHMEPGTETQDTQLIKESDTVSVSSTSNKQQENNVAFSSSIEESMVETVLLEPEYATEKTNRGKGSTESAAVSETIIANDSTDGNNVTDEEIANGSIPDIPELSHASAEDTTDTKSKDKVAEKESTSASDNEDKSSPASSSFTQATQVALPRDANEVVQDIALTSHGVEESDCSQHKESLQSDPVDLPVSRFLMDHILHQGNVPDEVGNVESENNIQEKTTDKLMNISIQEQEIFTDPLSAELVLSENIIENKDLEKLDDTILQQDNTPADVCDAEADNEIKQEHTSNEQKRTNIQEKEAIMDSESAQQIPEENTSEDRDQENPEDQVLREGIAPDDVCDVKAENIIIEEQKVTKSPLSAKEMPKNEDTDRAEVASEIVNVDQNHETKEDDEKPVAKDDESPQSNICLSSTTTASELVEIEVPSLLTGESATVIMDDYKGVTPTDQGDLGSEEGAERFTSPTSVKDEKITASPTETKIAENTRTFDNVERIDKDGHSISEEQITSAISELLGSTTTVVRSEEPQTHTKCKESKLETSKNIEASQVEVTENQVQNLNNDSVEEPEESTVEKAQLSDLLLLSRNQTIQKTAPAVTNVREQAEEAAYAKVKEEKTDEEKDENAEERVREEEQEEHKTDNNAAVIVEARETELKPAHKKSHNILSGVGSKVKHSIAKVKKAITGKSSHQKTISSKKATT